VVPLVLTLTDGDIVEIGVYVVDDGGALDAWENPGSTTDDWLGMWAPHTWESARVAD
jgi:hypothetical protein